METIQCIFCKNSKSSVVIEQNGFQGRQCHTCGLIYISPRPTLQEITDLYAHAEENIPPSQWRGTVWKRLHARYCLKLIKRYIRSGVALEVGPGGGFFLDEARKQSFEICGIELNSFRADYIRNTLKIPCETTALNSSSFGGRKYDLIYHCDVISHFSDPVSEFLKMNERLKQNAYLVFETGNLGDVDKKHFSTTITYFGYPEHLFFFSEKSIGILLSKTGFEIISVRRHSIVPQKKLFRVLRRVSCTSLSRKAIRKLVTMCREFYDLLKSTYNYESGRLAEDENNKKHNRNRFNVVSPSSSRVKRLLKKVYYPLVFFYEKWILYPLIFYLIRYKVGRLSPKKGRLQTIIVIAKKREEKRSEVAGDTSSTQNG